METLLIFVAAAALIWYLSTRQSSEGSDGLDWKSIQKRAEYYDQNQTHRIAISLEQRTLYLKGAHKVKQLLTDQKEYTFDQVRETYESKDGRILYVVVKDVDHPEWVIWLGIKNVQRWREIFRQHIFER